MVFAQGYTLKRSTVTKNIGNMSLYGVIGTIFSFIVVTVLLVEANNLSII